MNVNEMNVNEKNRHPRDDNVYSGMSRSHGGPLLSVSEISRASFPFDREARALAASKNEESPYYGMDILDILEKWEKGAEGGSKNHELFEKFFHWLPEDCKVRPELPKELNTPLVSHLCDFWFSKGYAERWSLYRTEWKVYSDKGVMAIIDAVFRDRGGNFLLVDWKTSKGIYYKAFEVKRGSGEREKAKKPFQTFDHCNYYEYSLQLCIERRILQEYDIRANYLSIINIPSQLASGEEPKNKKYPVKVSEHWPSRVFKAHFDGLWDRLGKETAVDVFLQQ